MIIKYTVLILCTVVLSIIGMMALKYEELRAEKNAKGKIQCLLKNTKKRWTYIIVMFALNIMLVVSMMTFYGENSILFDLKRLALVSIMWVAAFYDYRSLIIPNKLIVLGLIYRGIILIFELIFEREELLQTVISEVIAAVGLVIIAFLCVLIIRNSIGMGDIKLFLVMGLMQGVMGIASSMFISLLVSFVLAVFLLISRRKGRKDEIPFAPSLLLGTYIAIFITGV